MAFGSQADFTVAAFGSDADFTGAAFGLNVNCTGATFGSRATFNGATFGDWAIFAVAAFNGISTFIGAVFGFFATFVGAAFSSRANFTGATFGYSADFTGAAFDEGDFGQTHFQSGVRFTGMSEERWARKLARVRGMSEKARALVEGRLKASWQRKGSGRERFLYISFANARFDREAIFSRRSFERTADFTNARFYYPPDFDAAAKDARIDFTGAYIGSGQPFRPHWICNPKVPIRLRALRKIAEETKNHYLERDLYIEERKAERGVYLVHRLEELKKAPKREWLLIAARLLVHVLWIMVMFFYWALADYGRSFIRPAAWLIGSVFFFDWRYAKVLAPLMPKACPLGDQYERALGMLALGNAVPFVGPLTIEGEVKKFLFCAGDANCLPIPPEGFQLLVVGQNLVSIRLVFFIGLALRNYFRIK